MFLVDKLMSNIKANVNTVAESKHFPDCSLYFLNKFEKYSYIPTQPLFIANEGEP